MNRHPKFFRGDHPGAERSEGVEALRAEPRMLLLQIFRLQIPGAYVIENSESSNMLQCILSFDLCRFPADDHRELCLVVNPPKPPGDPYRFTGADHRGAGFGEYDRLFRYLEISFFRVQGIIQAER